MGVATTYLDSLRPGDKVQMAIRPSGVFHLPLDPSVPIVMIAAGSGIAPMRGFIQERALQKEAGRDVGKMTLFFGCRSPDDDFLYSKTDIEEWNKLELLEVRPAFSRDTEKSEGCKYVQEYVTLSHSTSGRLRLRGDLAAVSGKIGRSFPSGSTRAPA